MSIITNRSSKGLFQEAKQTKEERSEFEELTARYRLTTDPVKRHDLLFAMNTAVFKDLTAIIKEQSTQIAELRTAMGFTHTFLTMAVKTIFDFMSCFSSKPPENPILKHIADYDNVMRQLHIVE